MQMLKRSAIAAAMGVAAMSGPGMGVATAADIPVEPGPRVYQRAAPQYVPPPAEEEYTYISPPVVYRYAAPPPVVYYDAPPVVVYPPRYRYGYAGYGYRYGYAGYGYPRYRAYGPYANGYGHRHWRR